MVINHQVQLNYSIQVEPLIHKVNQLFHLEAKIFFEIKNYNFQKKETLLDIVEI